MASWDGAATEALLQSFVHDADEFTKALSSTLTLRQLNDAEITHFLRYCVTGEDRVSGLLPIRES